MVAQSAKNRPIWSPSASQNVPLSDISYRKTPFSRNFEDAKIIFLNNKNQLAVSILTSNLSCTYLVGEELNAGPFNRKSMH